MTVCQSASLSVWQSDSLTACQSDRLTFWQSDSLTVWQSGSLTARTEYAKSCLNSPLTQLLRSLRLQGARPHFLVMVSFPWAEDINETYLLRVSLFYLSALCVSDRHHRPGQMDSLESAPASWNNQMWFSIYFPIAVVKSQVSPAISETAAVSYKTLHGLLVLGRNAFWNSWGNV